MSRDYKIYTILTEIQRAASLLDEAELNSQSFKVYISFDENDEYDEIFEYLKELRAIKSAERIPLHTVGNNHRDDSSWPWCVEIFGNTTSPGGFIASTDSEPVKIIGTELHIGPDVIKLGKGSHDFTLQYLIALLTIRKPNKKVAETTIMSRYGRNYDINGRDRSISDATRMLNEKIKAATGIDRLFDYSAGYVTYRRDLLN